MASCSHLDTIADVAPSDDGCHECLLIGADGSTCGCASSAATSGAATTRRTATPPRTSTRPPTRSSVRFEPGEEWFWCYVDDVSFYLDVPPGPSHP